MQLMSDAIAVLGSRHGLVIDPTHRTCGIVRYDLFERLPQLLIHAGVLVDDVEYTLPLTPDGQPFGFHDQRLTPCTMSLTGILPQAALKVKLTIATPFRPRDAAFSTTPVLGLRLEASPLQGQYRWVRQTSRPTQVEIFVEFRGPAITVESSSPVSIDFCFPSQRFGPAFEDASLAPQRDRVVVVHGRKSGLRFTQTVDLAASPRATLDLAWCAFDTEGLRIRGTMHPFRYTRDFANLTAVSEWAQKKGGLDQIFANAKSVDGILARNNCGPAVNGLLATTLHAWLTDTWFIDRGGRDWFSVWEGNCYFHSTVDVEFTQAPFYLSVWPELLGIELDFWPEFTKDGQASIGERGSDTLFLSHDVGRGSSADGQVYPHDMEVEESANYVILAYGYWRRTGSDQLLHRHADTIEKFLRFITACDITGNGVPALGVANTSQAQGHCQPMPGTGAENPCHHSRQGVAHGPLCHAARQTRQRLEEPMDP